MEYTIAMMKIGSLCNTSYLPGKLTGFEMKMLKQFNTEFLIGQISYKKRADMYNFYNGYENRAYLEASMSRY